MHLYNCVWIRTFLSNDHRSSLYPPPLALLSKFTKRVTSMSANQVQRAEKEQAEGKTCAQCRHVRSSRVESKEFIQQCSAGTRQQSEGQEQASITRELKQNLAATAPQRPSAPSGMAGGRLRGEGLLPTTGAIQLLRLATRATL